MAFDIFGMFIVSLLYLLLDIHPFSSESDKRFCTASAKEHNSVKTHRKYENLRAKIESIKAICGDLCDTNSSRYEAVKENDSFHYRPLKKEVNCKNIWSESLDGVSEFEEPIQKLPIYLKNYFSHDGMVDLEYAYYDEKNLFKTLFMNESFVEWCKNKFALFGGLIQ